MFPGHVEPPTALVLTETADGGVDVRHLKPEECSLEQLNETIEETHRWFADCKKQYEERLYALDVARDVLLWPGDIGEQEPSAQPRFGPVRGVGRFIRVTV